MLKRFIVLYQSESREFYRKYKTLIWLCVVFVLLKTPSLFEPYWYGDEGVTLAVGGAIKKGYLLYRDVFDNKPPVLYLISALTGNHLYSLKLVALLGGLVGLNVFYWLVGFLYQANKRAMIISCLCYVVLTTTPIFEANIVNGEIIFVIFSITGWYLALAREKYWLAGLSFSLAFLTKVPALFDFWPIILWLFAEGDKTNPKARISHLSKPIIAFCLPVVISLGYFYAAGGLKEYVESTFLHMVGYVSSWSPDTNNTVSVVGVLKNHLIIKGLVLGFSGLVLGLYWKRSKVKLIPSLIVYWLISALFGATLSSRPYPHYLIQAIAPLCLLIGYVVFKWQRYILLTGTCLMLFMATYRYYSFWQYPVAGYYNNFGRFVIGKIETNEYLQFFDRQLPEIYQGANIIKSYTDAKDKIFIWSNYAQLYPMTKRLPVTRYVTAYHLSEDIDKNPNVFTNDVAQARAILVDKRIQMNAVLERLLAGNYFLVEDLPNQAVYINRAKGR